jgi:hypothetical protein
MSDRFASQTKIDRYLDELGRGLRALPADQAQDIVRNPQPYIRCLSACGRTDDGCRCRGGAEALGQPYGPGLNLCRFNRQQFNRHRFDLRGLNKRRMESVCEGRTSQFASAFGPISAQMGQLECSWAVRLNRSPCRIRARGGVRPMRPGETLQPG